MLIKSFRVPLLLLFVLSACKSRPVHISEVQGKQITISDSIPEDDDISAFILPYKKHIDEKMAAVLAYAPADLVKTDGELNTAIGNMMADAVMELASPVFKSRTGKSLDMVLLNFGGIRSSLKKGNVTTRSAYQIMPFENQVIVAAMSGQKVDDMVHFLIDSGTAHPVAGIELAVNENNAIEKILIQGEPLDLNKTYYVATNDYLYNGGDNMTFFSESKSFDLDYKLRNVLIDYFTKHDTIAPVKDNRFIRIK